MNPIIAIALGGAFGAVMRYLCVEAITRVWGSGFPMGTMIVNLLGSFAMGLALIWFLEKSADARVSVFLITGVLGGFTTFSAFSADTLMLVERGKMLAASGYVAGSVGLSLMAVFAGAWIMRSVLA